MEFLMLAVIALGGMFLLGLGGLIFSKENKKLYLTLMLIPIVILVIGFGTCFVILTRL